MYQSLKDYSVKETGYRLQVFNSDCDNPLHWGGSDIQWVMLHRGYQLENTTDITSENFSGWGKMSDYIDQEFDPALIIPVYMLDHSGLSLSIHSFNDGWDSGQIGFVFMSKEVLKRNYQDDENTAISAIEGELLIYTNYLNGECYRLELYHDGNLLESSDGFYGSNFNTNDIKECIEEYVSTEIAEELVANLEIYDKGEVEKYE